MNLHPILQQMSESESSLSLVWLGNLSWVLCTGGKFAAFDLDLHLELRKDRPPLSAEDLAPVLDVVFITHEHGDHFNEKTAIVLSSLSTCLFVMPESCTEKAERIGIAVDRICVARPGIPFSVQGIDVEPLHALHGHIHGSVYRGANFDDCGYVLNLGEYRVFQPGDTVLLHEHFEISDIDVMFVSPTEHNTHVEKSVHLIHGVGPKYVMPQHFDTYTQTPDNAYWTRGYPDELYEALPEVTKPRYHKLRQGEVFSIS